MGFIVFFFIQMLVFRARAKKKKDDAKEKREKCALRAK